MDRFTAAQTHEFFHPRWEQRYNEYSYSDSWYFDPNRYSLPPCEYDNSYTHHQDQELYHGLHHSRPRPNNRPKSQIKFTRDQDLRTTIAILDENEDEQGNNKEQEGIGNSSTIMKAQPVNNYADLSLFDADSGFTSDSTSVSSDAWSTYSCGSGDKTKLSISIAEKSIDRVLIVSPQDRRETSSSGDTKTSRSNDRLTNDTWAKHRLPAAKESGNISSIVCGSKQRLVLGVGEFTESSSLIRTTEHVSVDKNDNLACRSCSKQIGKTAKKSLILSISDRDGTGPAVSGGDAVASKGSKKTLSLLVGKDEASHFSKRPTGHRLIIQISGDQ